MPHGGKNYEPFKSNPHYTALPQEYFYKLKANSQLKPFSGEKTPRLVFFLWHYADIRAWKNALLRMREKTLQLPVNVMIFLTRMVSKQMQFISILSDESTKNKPTIITNSHFSNGFGLDRNIFYKKRTYFFAKILQCKIDCKVLFPYLVFSGHTFLARLNEHRKKKRYKYV